MSIQSVSEFAYLYYVFQESLSLKSKSSLKSSDSKTFAYSVGGKKSSPEPDESNSSDNTESVKFRALANNVHEVEALFTINDKKLVQDKRAEAELREKFKNLVIAFEEEKHSKDKLKLKRDKIKAQLKETTEALLEAQIDNDELVKHLKDEESQKQFYQVECTTLKDEVELLKRKLYVLESLEKERIEKVEHADSTGLLRLESQISTDSEMNYKTLYEGITTRHEEMEGIMSGTIERMKMELSDLKIENLGLHTKNSELSEKIQVLEPKWKEKAKELDNINEMIEALNMQIVDVHEKCSRGLCVSGQKLEKELKEKDEIMTTLQSQLSKSKMKRKEVNASMVALEKQIAEMESSKMKADEKFIEMVKEAEQLKCKLMDRDDLCNSGCCPTGMKFVSKDSETKYIVQKREDTISTLNAKVEKLNGKKDELRKELAVYKMEMINNENISKETEKLNRKQAKELVILKEDIAELRKRCDDGTCRSGSFEESEQLAEVRAELARRKEECQVIVEEQSYNKKKLTEISKERDGLKTKVADLEAMLEKTKTHSRLLTNETVSLSTQLADLERKLEVETSRREDNDKKDDEVKENKEEVGKNQGEEESHEKLLPISRTSSQLSSLSEFLEQVNNGGEINGSSSPELAELAEARKKITRQKEKIKNLKTEYLNLKDLVSETNAQIYDIMSDEKLCVRPSCKELRHKVDKSMTEIDLLKSKLEHIEMKNVDLNLDLTAATNKLAKKREDYHSLQDLLRTTLENCKELERKVKSQAAALEIAKVKGWGVAQPTDRGRLREDLRNVSYNTQTVPITSRQQFNLTHHGPDQKDLDFGTNKELSRVRIDENIHQNTQRAGDMRQIKPPIKKAKSRTMANLMANFEK